MKTALKYFLYFLLLLLLVFALVVATLPYSIPPLAGKLAERSGIALKLDTVSIDWLDGKLALHGLEVKSLDKPEGKAFSVDSLQLDIALGRLLKERALYIEMLELQEVDIPVNAVFGEGQSVGQLQVAGIDLLGREGEPEATEPDAAGQAPAIVFSGWQSIQLSSIRVPATLVRGEEVVELPLLLQRLVVEDMLLENTEQPVAFGGELEINHGELDFSGQVAPLAPGREGHVALALKKLELARWQPLLDFLQIETGPVRASRGELTLATNLEWWLAGDRSFATLDTLELSLDELDLSDQAGARVEQQDDRKSTASNSYRGNLDTRIEELKLQTNPVEYQLANLQLNSDKFAIHLPAYDPAFDLAIGKLSITLDQLDSQQPESPMSISLKTGLGRYGKIEAKGAGSFLAEKPSGRLDLQAEQVNLPAFSGLAKNAIGKHIDKGALDFTYNALLDKGILDSKAKFEVHQLGLSGDYGTENNVVEELGMPINAALNLLRDKDDTVRLSIPVKGDIKDPQIEIGSVVNKAVMNGVKTAVLTQFGPLMALSALDKARSMADALKLKPVYFQPLQTEVASLDKESTERVEKIAKLLESRPKIKLNVCGMASASELAAEEASPQSPDNRNGQQVEVDSSSELNAEQQQQLNQVATLRGEHVKDLLMQKNIEGKRLILCAPRVVETGVEGAQVEFSL